MTLFTQDGTMKRRPVNKMQDMLDALRYSLSIQNVGNV